MGCSPTPLITWSYTELLTTSKVEDRNNAKLDMIGIKASNDIVSEIRCRVEFNKKNKGIYEITNRS